MKIKTATYHEILSYYFRAPPEQGGIIGEKNNIVCAYAHDFSLGDKDKAVFIPDTRLLNNSMNQWKQQGISFSGIIHSHPNNQNTLSLDDIAYAKQIFDLNPHLEDLLFPIIMNDKTMIVYRINCGIREIQVQRESIEFID